ncbi:T9SS C-terminal target domain-containing protein, partial [bacterium]
SQLPVASNVKLVVYDVLGREVAVLVDERRAAGQYQDNFDGSGLASGMYIYRLKAGSFVQSRTMLLLK